MNRLLPSERLGVPPTTPNVDLKLAHILAAALFASLPHWHFEPYGTRGAVACFPPDAPSPHRWNELARHAPITSVCGPLYVVTRLRQSIIPEPSTIN